MATAYDVIHVSIRTNDTEHPEVRIECEMDWSISRVKQQIQNSHPRHYPTDTQVIYYAGHRADDSISLSRLFHVPTPRYTLWLAVVTEDATVQEFLSLSRTTSAQNRHPSSDLNPYHSALQYYNYINSRQTDTTDPIPPLVPPVEQEQPPPLNPEEFNFLGARRGGVGLEEAQEQNVIFNAINLIVRLSLLLYITYQFAPQFKFYLVVAFSALTFLYQVGLFRVNRVNILRFQQVEEGLRHRENNDNNDEERDNTQEEPVRTKPAENAEEIKSESSDQVEEIGVVTEEEGVVRQRIGGQEVTEEVTTQNNPGVLTSLSLLLYNLVLSFHPEHNV